MQINLIWLKKIITIFLSISRIEKEMFTLIA